MANNTERLTRHDLEAKIVRRSWEDEAFRGEFIADPAGAFVKYLNVPAAALPKIAVHQQEPGSWHIVLPAKPANMNELSEQDLERVAGGVSINVINSVVEMTLPVFRSLALSAVTTVTATAASVISTGIAAGEGW
jgi:hypothetical protein